MHLVMIFTALSLAVTVRLLAPKSSWQLTLFFFLFPPLLLLTTAVAVLCMGPEGEMLGLQASWFSYFFVFGFISFALILLLKLAYQAWQSQQEISTYPVKLIQGKAARILATSFPYSAQIGFWQPQLVVSWGIINGLDEAHLAAVLAHEQAHYYYHDTFWFFWLGWLRSGTAWLPHTETLWQELLFYREIRADEKAAEEVDALLLAESLLFCSQAPFKATESFCAPFCCAIPRSRLAERIDALLTERTFSFTPHWWVWSWLVVTLLPLFTLPFHN
ncbi:MAG: M48 family metalloprotease [Gomphosphaeria aponina SAG 52.96 = DSM 107014]|uniref:M48 family metalloprotease n=1 Tax=Gomphosphaeria aponina SAG 52.96 = DSM 107014 TaxID=1521640 RepID=A0A941JT11_9CHRO|nr:M48 family metalloprotease [Gomphosphaeria aponina SAG 52.96 = DSM 107014]